MKFPYTICKASLEAMYQAKLAEYDAIDITTPEGQLEVLFQYNPIQAPLTHCINHFGDGLDTYVVGKVDFVGDFGVSLSTTISYHITKISADGRAVVTVISYTPERVTQFIVSGDKNRDHVFLVDHYIALYNIMINNHEAVTTEAFTALTIKDLPDIYKRIEPFPLFTLTDEFYPGNYNSGQDALPRLLDDIARKNLALPDEYELHTELPVRSLKIENEFISWTPAYDIQTMTKCGVPMTMTDYVKRYNSIQLHLDYTDQSTDN